MSENKVDRILRLSFSSSSLSEGKRVIQCDWLRLSMNDEETLANAIIERETDFGRTPNLFLSVKDSLFPICLSLVNR